MKYDDFRERVLEEIQPLLPEEVEDVFCIPVTKNNGVEYSGLIIRDNTNISPTIYLEPYYYDYLNGRSFDVILADIVKTYADNKFEYDFDSKKIFEWDYVKSHVVRRLVNYEQNEEMLEQTPHLQVEDLAIMYQIVVSDMMEEKGYATIAVRDDFLKRWNISLDKLDEAARHNTPLIIPPRLDNLAAVYAEIAGVDVPFLEEMNVYILTDKYKINGAIHVLDSEIMKEVGEELGADICYVIPSSVHEVLIMPYDEEYDYSQLEEVVNEVNRVALQDVDILSDRAYIIDAKEGKFMLASKYEDYRKQLELHEKQQKISKDMLEQEQKPKL